MQSPPIEWSLLAAHAVALDVIRDRGEPDGDTATEVLRTLFRVETTEGRARLAAAIAVGGVLLYRHLTKPQMRPMR